jgi:hypothetical protein
LAIAMPRRHVALLCAGLAACYSAERTPSASGGSASTATAAGGAGGAPSRGGAGGASTTSAGGAIPTTDPCAGYTAPGDPADIAASPREDESAEILAFEVTASAVAPAWAYEKIHADLVAIRAAGPPAIAEIHAVPSVYWL